MATTTSASSTQAPTTTEIEYIDLKANARNRQFLKDWAEMKVNKAFWDKREKDLKAQLDAETGYKSLQRERGDKLFVRLAGAVRLRFTWGERTDVDVKLLLEAFPEAHAATKRTNVYPTVAAV